MPRKKRREHDFSITAFRVVQEATGQIEPEPKQIEPELIEGKNPHAVALGKLGGLKGGKARAAKLTPEQRKEIAQKAAHARWKTKQP
ncbi:MAG: histone H1 [Dehalococcoidia bacterium]